MTVAIKSTSDGEVIWFAAVLKYDRQFSASVSKHPLEDGSNISDNTTTENPVYTISGLVSDTDFNQLLAGVSQEKDIRPTLMSTPKTVTITQGPASKFQKYLPESVGQFFGHSSPTVTMDTTGPVETADKVRRSLERRWKAKEVFHLIEYKVNAVKAEEAITNCVLTSLSFTEDPDSGEGLYVNLTFEQVAIANSKQIKIQKKTTKKLANAAAAGSAKGPQATTATEGTIPAAKQDRSIWNRSVEEPVGAKK
jgi:hypothetical protein